MDHLQHCCSVTLMSYFRHPTSGNEVNVPAAGPRTHVNSDQRVCLNMATVLILSAVKSHSYCDDNKEITEHSLDFNERDRGCQLQNNVARIKTMPNSELRHKWCQQPILGDSSIDSDDIIVESDVLVDDDERDVWCIWWNDKSHVLISTGVSTRKKKTDAFDDFGCTKQGKLLNVTIFLKW